MRAALFSLLALSAWISSLAVAAADDIEAPRCVHITKSAPYRGYGHNHIVHLHNTCEDSVRCRISTDATPEQTMVDLDPEESKEIVTRVGSPSSIFEVRANCEIL